VTAIPSLFIATTLLYGLAAGLYLFRLARSGQHDERFTHIALGVAVVSHAAFLLSETLSTHRDPFDDIHGTLSVLSFGTAVAFLLATLRYRVAVLGAFITPITLLFLLASGVAHQVAPVPSELRHAMLPLHVGVIVFGLVAFAIAFGSSTAYIVQERKLRRKELGGVFKRLPPLDVLDTVSYRALSIGFPLFTIGVVVGALWIARAADGSVGYGAAQIIGLVTWFVFASVMALRVLAGWRGRRAALGTMFGFTCAVVVLAIYVFQPEAGS